MGCFALLDRRPGAVAEVLCLARDPRLDVAPAPSRVDDADRYANVRPQVPNEEIRNGAEGADVLPITRRPRAAGEIFPRRARPRIRHLAPPAPRTAWCR